MVLGEGLVIKEFEICFLRELGYDIVVVGVEPVQSCWARTKANIPLQHLGRGDIDTTSLPRPIAKKASRSERPRPW